VAQLLVSVRSADEARAALAGGASIIDVKEPDHGSLGLAPWTVWRDVHTAVSTAAPISVALGELPDWLAPDCPVPPSHAWPGISFCKLGLAGTDVRWQGGWRAVRSRLDHESGPPWIAVIYADWQGARAPEPDCILEEVISCDHIVGVLVDTWDKTRAIELDERWVSHSARVRQAGKLVAMAGGLDCRSIATLGRIAPDIVAVRGAACVDGNRRSAIDSGRVAELSPIVRALPSWPDAERRFLSASGYQPLAAEHDHEPTSNFTPCASGISEP
jgi:(5-formylfuran-3-yl)methyl phosphate synthase